MGSLCGYGEGSFVTPVKVEEMRGLEATVRLASGRMAKSAIAGPQALS